MSIFSETIIKAISNYRSMLRKYLPQAERVSKLADLNLKNPQLYSNEATLYQTAYKIVEDIEQNFDTNSEGYYSYSGIGNFGKYLKEFLQNYSLEGSSVIHHTQKASRALVEAIQLLTLPKEKLSPSTHRKLAKLNHTIATCGSEEQKELHRSTLQQAIRHQQEQNIAFYRTVLDNFRHAVEEAA